MALTRFQQLAEKQRAERLAGGTQPPSQPIPAKSKSQAERIADIKAQPAGIDVGRMEQYRAAMATAIINIREAPANSDERTRRKKSWLPEFMPFIDGYIEAGDIYANDVAVQAMVWLWDVGDIEQAVRISLYLIGTGNQQMPERFERRDLPTFVVDEMGRWCANNLKQKSSSAPYLGQVLEAMDGPTPWELAPAKRAGLYVAAAKDSALIEDWPAVVSWSDKASAAYPAIGVKGLRDSAAKKAEQKN